MSFKSILLSNFRNRKVVYQIGFILLFAILTPILKADISAVISDHKQVIYLGILGIGAIIADTIGTVIKSRELRIHHNYHNKKWFGRYFVFFWIFRVSLFGFGGIIIGTSLTGKDIGSGNWLAMTFMIIEALRWLIMGFVSYFTISEGKERTISKKNIFEGDMLIFVSSLFYLTCLWTSMNISKTPWLEMTSPEKYEYAFAGFLLFLILYIPCAFFQFAENLLKAETKKDKLLFWLSIFVTGAIALAYPMI